MSILEEPTDEYTMRHAANELSRMARGMKLSADQETLINFAYQQLHRGANTLHDAPPRAVEVELFGGPGAGRQFTVADPPPRELTILAAAMPAMWQREADDLATAEVETATYTLSNSWNPTNGRRLYVK